MSKRFLQIFQMHGVEPTQIPRLIHSVTLNSLQSEEKLLGALTPDVLAETAALFGIRRDWLEGIDDEIYEYLACYKRPQILLEHIARLIKASDGDASFPLRVLTTTKQLDYRDTTRYELAPVLVEKIAEHGDNEIFRYHVYRDGFSWDHPPARLELKAIARIVCTKLHTPVPLFLVSKEDMDAVLEGRLVPRQLVNGCLQTSPSLEYFALSKKECGVAKDEVELQAVLNYIQQEGLNKFFSAESCDLSLVPAEEAAPITSDVSLSGASPLELKVATVHSDWTVVAREIADELDLKDASMGAFSSTTDIAERVATEMRKRKTFGPRGPLAGGTVLREALQGGRWQRKRLNR